MSYDLWLTPPDILDRVRTVFNGSIDFDPASNFIAQEYVRAYQFCVAPTYAHDEFNDHSIGFERWQGQYIVDGLVTPWAKNVFCNPPYSAGNIDRFVDKGIAELARRNVNIRNGHNAHTIDQMIFLVNSATDCKWYHKLLNNCDTALLWRGRIKFWKIENGKAHEKWEGVLSKEKGLGKVGNSPRYLNTLFYFGNHEKTFMDTFADKGTFIKVAANGKN